MIKKNDRENSNIPHVMGKRERIKKESSWLISNGFAFVLISARNMTGNCSKPLSILLGFRSSALIEHRSIIWKIFLKIEMSPNQQIEMLAFRFEHKYYYIRKFIGHSTSKNHKVMNQIDEPASYGIGIENISIYFRASSKEKNGTVDFFVKPTFLEFYLKICNFHFRFRNRIEFYSVKLTGNIFLTKCSLFNVHVCTWTNIGEDHLSHRFEISLRIGL